MPNKFTETLDKYNHIAFSQFQIVIISKMIDIFMYKYDYERQLLNSDQPFSLIPTYKIRC